MRTKRHLKSHPWQSLMAVLITVVMLFGSQAPSFVTDVQAGNPAALALFTNTMTLRVENAVSLAEITTFKYMINIDNTGTTDQRSDPATGEPPFECTPEDPTYPDNCFWTSMGIAGSSPIYTSGTESDFAGGAGLDLPDGRYLISVMADGFRLDGEHFTVPFEDSGLVTVKMQAYDLPDVTIQAAIFEDISPTNSGPDLPAEHGLAGFVGHIADYIGEVTTDVYGNPLCGNGVCISKCYVVDNGVDIGTVAPVDSYGRCPTNPTGLTMIEGGAVPATAAIEGKLIIPNLGPNRYALSVVAPDGNTWIQTTTLEGNHDWDAWVMEGANGLDTEFVVAGEPFPATFFGFVQQSNSLTTPASGQITGVIAATKVYIPTTGGVALPGDIWGGLGGGKIDHVMPGAWVSLSDLQNGDTAVYIGQTDANGAFTINNVPDGSYFLAYWDEPQDYILNWVNVTVFNGEPVDMGVLPLNGWWTTLEGYVFNDLNRNGFRDEGEPGLAGFPVVMRKRENSVMDRGAVMVTTDANGYYFMENLYPMTQWLIVEAYADLYYTTGITYQADNQPTPTTVLGQGVDVNILPIIGLGGTLDWGLHSYSGSGGTAGIDPNNGGIVGTVSYDTTRNELDPRFAAVEDWQPGISDLTVNLYAPVACAPGDSCDASGRYKLAADGSYEKGSLLNSVVTETWEQPKGCIARDVNGDPLAYPVGQQVLPNDPSKNCLEGPLMGVQFGPMEADGNFGAAVNGNYGFGDGCFGVGGFDTALGACADASAPTELLPGDYLVEVETPTDALGRPMYQVTREEDINIFNGDSFVPQIPPPACIGALHTVDIAGSGTDNYGPVTLPNGITVPASTPIDNQPFADGGGSVFEGTQKPLCDMKLVRVSNGRSVAPTFNFFTQVPLPGRFWGLLVDDLNFSSNPKSLLYGEKPGIPFAPVGIYDYTNRLITTVESDYNGLFDVLLPSTNRIDCPTPSGVCANLYRLVGNDAGNPQKWNPNYKPQFRTISAEFEALPGLIVPADLAPTQVGVNAQLPGSQFEQAVACLIEPTRPQLFAVDKPYAYSDTASSINIYGAGFGTDVGQVTLDGVAMPTTAWDDSAIQMSIPAGTAAGPHQLLVKAANGLSTINGLTFHEFGTDVVNGAFPASSAVFDNFDRAALGTNWSVDNASVFVLNSNYLRIRTGPGNTRNAWWNVGLPFGTNQEAYFAFTQVSNQAGANEQGLLLKYNSASSPNSINAQWIEVAYNNTPANTLRIRTKVAGSATITDQATFIGVTLAANDQLGARAFSNGTIIAYKNGVEIGRTTVASTGAWTGRIGLRFEGTGTTAATEARIDNFGGGDTSATITTYEPNLYEVGPGYPYATIQSAIDAASNGSDSLVVVYPTASTTRLNPLGAYYENIIISAPIKLQGVGSGGVYSDGTFVGGSIIDGAAFGGDSIIAANWEERIAGMTWVGNQTVGEGETILMVAQDTAQYGSNFKAAIDGFTLRGGDQQGQANILTQGGAIFANSYVRNLQITNNLIQNNSASYGTVRIGTPDLPGDASSHNENLRIANNRVIANGSTNLAGGLAIFAGADNYEVAGNDICGNFSAEYGGGMTVYGYSPNGKIHHNRIYVNQSYDEGAGVMIAGQLPADPTILSPGSGPTDIYNNLIQHNLSNDDGGGLRFLMAGNYPMNVYNNMIVNNVSTHEGGGIAINDTPDVRIYNNTIAKNVTTATAVTSNGFPAPAGLATGANSVLLQNAFSLPVFSSPLLFNNIFWDNRAGTRGLGTVSGLSDGDANVWDLGVSDGSGVLSIDPSNLIGVDPTVRTSYNTALSFVAWRTNANFIDAILLSVTGSPTLMGDYHLSTGSPAIDAGISSLSGSNAPANDFDGETRNVPPDTGADELITGGGGGGGGGSPALFPSTPVLDDFNRAAGVVGSNWTGNTSSGIFRILASQDVQVRKSGRINWNPTSFGANQEAYFTFTDIGAGSEQGVFLKFNGNSTTAKNASFIEAAYYPSNHSIRIWTKVPNRNKGLNFTQTGITFASGDVFGVRIEDSGMVTLFQNGTQIGQTNVTTGINAWTPALSSGGGRIGVWFFGNFSGANDARFDNFGGGTMP
ncbi:MAG: hypothetical protein HZB50_06485 [Chloroflexi bacterium]|nr:hypothetical protein [Chloroflexota bacterium]